MNNVKTALLLGALTGLLLLLGEALGGRQGLVLGLGMAVATNFIAYFFSDRIVLAMYGARPLTPEEAPRVHAMLDELCARAGLPVKPKVHRIPSPALNAFATGRNPKHASIAFTDGILEALSEDELRGVAAHELAHVKNRDILTSTVAATIAGAITFLARMAFWFGGGRDREGGGNPIAAIATLLLAPIAAVLIQLWISRTREYQADRTGAAMAGHPYGLISALGKLEAGSKRMPLDANPATAHLFIVKPFSGRSVLSLFQTHPPIEKRIERLREISSGR